MRLHLYTSRTDVSKYGVLHAGKNEDLPKVSWDKLGGGRRQETSAEVSVWSDHLARPSHRNGSDPESASVRVEHSAKKHEVVQLSVGSKEHVPCFSEHRQGMRIDIVGQKGGICHAYHSER